MTFHAAARRQLSYFWPRVVGNTGWELLDTKFAVVAQSAQPGRPSGQHRRRARPRRRNRMGQGVFDQPGDYAVRRRRGRSRHPTRRGQGRGRLRSGTRSSRPAATGRRCSTSTTCCCTPPPPSRTTRRSRRSSATGTAASSSTNTRTSPRCSSGCSTPGSASATISPSSATPTRPSTRSPVPRRSYLLDFSRRFPDAAVVRLERDYRSTPQVVSLANRVIAAARGRMAGSKLHLVGQRDPGPTPTFAEHPDEVAEAASVARTSSGSSRPVHRTLGDRGAVPHQRAVGGLRGGAHRGGRSVSGPRR